MTSRDTIAAIATAPGRGGIGVVRISGRDLLRFASDLISKPLQARRAVLTAFRDHAGDSIDEGIALFFPAPHSYTGEDVIELQGHGGPVVMRQLLQRPAAAAPGAPGQATAGLAGPNARLRDLRGLTKVMQSCSGRRFGGS